MPHRASSKRCGEGRILAEKVCSAAWPSQWTERPCPRVRGWARASGSGR